MMERDFKKALEQFDHEVKNVPVGPSSSRVWARLSREEKAPMRWGLAVGAAAALLLGVVGVWGWQSREPSAQSVAGFTVQSSEETVVAEVDGTLVVSRGDTVLSDEDVVLNVSADTKVKRSQGAIKLVKGKMTVSARHRRKEERSLRFLVSGGTVEVVGTRFTLIDDGTRGNLTLHEGVVRFISNAGETTQLRAGETIDWPPERRADLVAPEPVVEPEPVVAPEPSPVVEKPVKMKRKLKTAPTKISNELNDVLERVAELRDRGQHEEAVVELRRALGKVREPMTRERLSFEIGSLLTHQVDDRERACEHWRKHEKVFGAGRYAQEFRLLTQQLRCELDSDSK